MRVLMIEHFLPGNTYTKELCTELQKIVPLSVLCGKRVKRSSGESYLKCCLYNGGSTNTFERLMKYSGALKSTALEILFGHSDIVHVQTFKNAEIEIPMYIRLCVLKKKAVVHTVHNILPHEPKQKDKELYGGFYRKCDALIVHNKHTKEQLISLFQLDAARIYVVPHGTYTAESIQSKTPRENETVFLMFGAMRKYKGIDVLIRAVARVPQNERSKMKVIIAGTKWEKLDDTDYNGMIEALGLSDTIELMPYRIDDDKVAKLFARADACIFPYKEIYGSGALLMAYSHQKSVIVSDVPVFIEETDNGRTGLLFESENPDALAKAICEFVSLPKEKKEEFRENIAELVDNKYNWKRSSMETYKVYEKVLKEQS